ncbi:MAG: type II toxin-antitoxin system PemK/MazF family toxin [Bacteroidetes bacterium]|nr:type II toxin-antitoxin system PemK/MazF family toxin [Bacteroidota bacterium]
MRQGEIFMANLNPTRGNEQRGLRPVVIVSGNAMNDHFGVVIVMPLSTKIKKYAGCILLKKDKINNLKQDSEVITFQLRSVSKDRLTKKMGNISGDQLHELKKKLLEVLTY